MTNFKPFRRGEAFKAPDKLYLASDYRMFVIRGGERPCAWVKSRARPIWLACRPLRLRISAPNDMPYLPEGHPDAAEALVRPSPRERFSRTIPDRIRENIAPFANRHFHLYAAHMRVPRFDDIAESNPGLAYALASCWCFARNRPRRPMAALRVMVLRRRREICHWLGFPETEAAVHILAKVPPASLSVARLFYLRQAMTCPDVLKQLMHLRRINASVIYILSQPALRARTTPALIREIAATASEDRWPRLGYLLAQCERYFGALGERTPLRSIDDINILGEVVAYFGGEIDEPDRPFPQPPFPPAPGMEPITSPLDLFREGYRQHNCIFEYRHGIEAGKIYAYRILEPERATLTIVSGDDGWCIGGLRLARNRPIQHDATALKIYTWFYDSFRAHLRQIALPITEGHAVAGTAGPVQAWLPFGREDAPP